MPVDLIPIAQPIEPIAKELVSERGPCKKAIHAGVTAVALTILPAIAFAGSLYWFGNAIDDVTETGAPVNNPSTGASCFSTLGTGILTCATLVYGAYAGWEMGPATFCREAAAKTQKLVSECFLKKKDEDIFPVAIKV